VFTARCGIIMKILDFPDYFLASKANYNLTNVLDLERENQHFDKFSIIQSYYFKVKTGPISNIE
jgi:hypothetical protein